MAENFLGVILNISVFENSMKKFCERVWDVLSAGIDAGEICRNSSIGLSTLIMPEQFFCHSFISPGTRKIAAKICYQ